MMNSQMPDSVSFFCGADRMAMVMSAMYEYGGFTRPFFFLPLPPPAMPSPSEPLPPPPPLFDLDFSLPSLSLLLFDDVFDAAGGPQELATAAAAADPATEVVGRNQSCAGGAPNCSNGNVRKLCRWSTSSSSESTLISHRSSASSWSSSSPLWSAYVDDDVEWRPAAATAAAAAAAATAAAAAAPRRSNGRAGDEDETILGAEAALAMLLANELPDLGPRSSSIAWHIGGGGHPNVRLTTYDAGHKGRIQVYTAYESGYLSEYTRETNLGHT